MDIRRILKEVRGRGLQWRMEQALTTAGFSVRPMVRPLAVQIPEQMHGGRGTTTNPTTTTNNLLLSAHALTFVTLNDR